MLINSIYADNIIKTALLEDITYLDTTTDYLIDVLRLHCEFLRFYSRQVLRLRFIKKTAICSKRAILLRKFTAKPVQS